ncbi:hypothetical protein E3U43_007010 [Larimichthys crocea]|uniref:Uncharacterized protein n=1 Tax=Larimichthys crocea TaxID=215358 RepID=A0ACD3RMB7_LARCR|nr:hypothetical protein E3U43_007010 [Larimichthys crocea]
MDCFSSADLNAMKSTLLYAHNNDEDDLWYRDDTARPLESCFPLRPRHSQCTVCLHDRTVYAMCDRLADGVRVMMEAGGKSVSISKSDHTLIGLIATLIIIILIIIGVVVYRKRCKNRNKMTKVTAEADEENHSPPLLMNAINNGPQQHAGIQQSLEL